MLAAERQALAVEDKRPPRGTTSPPRWQRREEGEAKPTPPFVEPFLWIITAGRPSSALSLLGAVPAEGWPRGVYMSPGKLLVDDLQHGGDGRVGAALGVPQRGKYQCPRPSRAKVARGWLPLRGPGARSGVVSCSWFRPR